jgi:sigma-B regulation protein RsbU (phosphoserine phosphatase)
MIRADSPRTLIADDQPDVLEALRLLLKDEGFQTEAVSSPMGVLEALEQRNFDLLLMDLNYARDTTSGREGLDLLSRVRAIDGTLPIVVMTAWANVDITLEALREGVADFVLKPWENRQLIDTIRRHVESGQLARRSRRLNVERARELDDARAIQERLIPQSISQAPGYSITARWEPARTVGGDYYDVLSFGEDVLALCIGDVSGKGMPAALLMSNFQAAVRAHASRTLAPADLCATLNEIVATNTDSDRFISFFYGVLDAPAGKFTYANAGHNAPILVRADGQLARLEHGGYVLGPLTGAVYEQCQTPIKPGDRIVMFTDGVTEARNESGEEFGEERLIELVVKSRKMDAARMKERIFEALLEFTRGEFDDDVTIVALSAQ